MCVCVVCVCVVCVCVCVCVCLLSHGCVVFVEVRSFVCLRGLGYFRPGTALLDKSYKYIMAVLWFWEVCLCSHGLHLFDQKIK